MEKRSAAPSFPDASTADKISKSNSFSELPLSRRILIERCHRADACATSVGRYSREEIFLKSSDVRRSKVTEVARMDGDRTTSGRWKTKIPGSVGNAKKSGSLENASWNTEHFKQLRKAIEPPSCRVVYSKETEGKDDTAENETFEKTLPTAQLNGLKISDSNNSKSIVKFHSEPVTKVELKAKDRKVRREKKRNVSSSRNIKKNMRSLVANEDTHSKTSESRWSYSRIIFYLFVSLFVLILAMIIHIQVYSFYKTDFNFVNMTEELRERVFGQDDALMDLIYELIRRSNGVNLIVLVGGTGVGKSYSVGIVRNYFSYKNHIFEYSSPLRNNIRGVFENLSRLHCNLLILENLRKQDLTRVIDLVGYAKDQPKKFCIYVLAIFNPQNVGEDLSRHLELNKSIREMTSALRQTDLHNAKIIGFQPLDNRSLELCVRQAAIEKNIIFTESELSEIRSSLVSSNSGCKGAYAKVQLINS